MKWLSGLVGILVIFWLWEGWNHLPYHMDARLYSFPDQWVNLEAFHKGFIPLWNPYIACGVPQLASWISASLYPPFWWFTQSNISHGFMDMAFAHLLFAFAGCFLWLRSQSTGDFFAFLGSLSFAFSAHLTTCLPCLHQIATAAWIPWVFWRADAMVKKANFQNGFLLGMAISLQLFAGYLFFVFYTLVYLCFWLASQKLNREIIGRLFLIFLSCLWLTSIQWLPFVDFFGFSHHDTWKEYPYFTKLVEYGTLLNPEALGFPGTSAYRGSFANAAFNLYFGLAAFLIWAIQCFWFKRIFRAFWFWASLVGLAWLAGPHFPPWKIIPLKWLEILEPSKAVGLFIFSATTSVSLFLAETLGRLKDSFFSRATIFILGGLWVVDLVSVPFRLVHPFPNPFSDPQVTQNAGALRQWAGDQRMLSLQGPERFTFSGREGFGRSYLDSVLLFLCNSNEVWGLRSPNDYLILKVGGIENLHRYMETGFPYLGDLLDVAGVRLFLLSQSLPRPKYEKLGAYQDESVYLNTQASEDFWTPSEKIVFPSRGALLETLAGPGNQWRKKAYLEGDTQGHLISLVPSQAGLALPPATTGPSRPIGSRASLQVQMKNPGYLAFNESCAPGWRAWVDGVPQPILRAYGLFMAVAVKEGRHQVDFRYEPIAFRLGLFLSLATLAFWAGFAWKIRGSRPWP